MNRGSEKQPARATLSLSGFNEAPIHESGKCGGEVSNVQARHLASMRPRFMNRGSRARWQRLRVRLPGFNEAPIHESGKLGRCT